MSTSLSVAEGASPVVFLKRFPPGRRAFRELRNALYFGFEEGWRSPLLLSFHRDAEGMTIAYERVSGETLFEHCVRLRKRGKRVELALVREVVRQNVCLSDRLLPERRALVHTRPLPRLRIFDAVTQVPGAPHPADLDRARHALSSALELTASVVPGFSFDRNARNIMVSDDAVYQVDPEVITRASPLLDLALTLRSHCTVKGPDLAVMAQLDETSGVGPLPSLRMLAETDELVLVDWFRGLHPRHSIDERTFLALFRLACMYVHLYYLGFPLQRMLAGTAPYELLPRHAYHALSLLADIDHFEHEGARETLATLHPQLSLTPCATRTLAGVATRVLASLRADVPMTDDQ